MKQILKFFYIVKQKYVHVHTYKGWISLTQNTWNQSASDLMF